ncbi:hypothetical protein RU89_GL002043 [Lactococcus cremoris]|nr:hypothetical protein RU89_GL002043 [Lactococcus cremoris]
MLIVGNWITQAVPWLLLDMMTLFFSIFCFGLAYTRISKGKQ